jgi:hypothetical protein
MISGYVAFLDVLGFSNLIGGDHVGERIEKYLESVKSSIEGTPVQYVVFSDSIMLTVEGETPDSLIEVAKVCSKLFHSLLKVDIALRGAIAFGPFWRSAIEKSVFVAGRAIVEAYQFEQIQDWVGVMIAPSARGKIKDLDARCKLNDSVVQTIQAYKEFEFRLPWAALIQPNSQIPFHSSDPVSHAFGSHFFDGFAIVPTSGVLDPLSLKDSSQEAIDRMQWLRSIAPSPTTQAKYNGAINWLGNIQRTWHSVHFFLSRLETEKKQ